MTDMVVGFPFAPKQYRANYVCLEMRGGSFFLHYYLWIPLAESNFIDTVYKRGMWEGRVGSERTKRERKMADDWQIYMSVCTHVNIWSKKKLLTHPSSNSSQMCVEVCVVDSICSFPSRSDAKYIYLRRVLYLKAQPILMRIFLVTFHSYTFTQRKIFV